MTLKEAVPSAPVVMVLPPIDTAAPESGAPYSLVTTSWTVSRISPVILTVRPEETLVVCVMAEVTRSCVAVSV